MPHKRSKSGRTEVNPLSIEALGIMGEAAGYTTSLLGRRNSEFRFTSGIRKRRVLRKSIPPLVPSEVHWFFQPLARGCKFYPGPDTNRGRSVFSASLL